MGGTNRYVWYQLIETTKGKGPGALPDVFVLKAHFQNSERFFFFFKGLWFSEMKNGGFILR